MLMRDVVGEWRKITLKNLPRITRLKAIADQMYREHTEKIVRKGLSVWKDVACGPSSRRNLRKKNRERMMIARQVLQKEMQASGMGGIITNEMVVVEMRKQIMREIEDK